MYGYIYLIINLINGKKYIGQRARNFNEDSKYLGSGTIIKRAVSKYGSENFKKELLEECSSAEELDEREEFWIAKFDAVNSSEFYNLTPGRNGSIKGSKRSEITKLKLSNSAKNRLLSEETKQKISNTVSNQLWFNDGIKEFKINKEDVTDDILQKYQRGRLSIDRNSNWYKSICQNGHRNLTEEEKMNLSNKNSGSGNPFYGKHHSKESREKMSMSRKGTIYVNKDGINRRIHKEELQEFLDNNWVRGMIKVQRLSKA